MLHTGCLSYTKLIFTYDASDEDTSLTRTPYSLRQKGDRALCEKFLMNNLIRVPIRLKPGISSRPVMLSLIHI